MSGGLAFVLDEDGTFESRCNMGMVQVEALAESEDEALLRTLIEEHVARTGSVRGKGLLAKWPGASGSFKKVIATEYKRVLEARRQVSALAATATGTTADALVAAGAASTVPVPRGSDAARHLTLIKSS
jgi:glutamate synthase domain-containing protein 3